MAPRFRILRQTALVPLLDYLAMVGADSAGLPFEPQNVEQGISNVEVTPFCTLRFPVPYSIFSAFMLLRAPVAGAPEEIPPSRGAGGCSPWQLDLPVWDRVSCNRSKVPRQNTGPGLLSNIHASGDTLGKGSSMVRAMSSEAERLLRPFRILIGSYYCALPLITACRETE